MKPICTIPFIFIIACFIIACARAPDPVYPPIEPLPCEPTGLINLPEGKCVGTKDSRATMADETCVCQQNTYVPVPNGAGYVCMHLDHVLFQLEQAYNALEALKLPTMQEAEDRYYPARPDKMVDVARHRMLQEEIERLHAQLLRQPSADTDESFRRIQQDLSLLASQQRTSKCVRIDPCSRDDILQRHAAL